MDFISFEQSIAFIDAFQDIYGIDLSEGSEGPFLDGSVHHGVYSGAGEPLSSHTLNPNDDSRILMQNDVDGTGGKPLYGGNPFGGICRDASGNSYSSVQGSITTVVNGTAAVELDKCFNFC